jgi:hypothetical protein
MKTTLNTYLSRKAYLMFRDNEKKNNNYIIEIKGRFIEHDFEQSPQILLKNLTDAFTLEGENDKLEMRIITAIRLFAELNIEDENIEIEIISFLQNKLIPYIKMHNYEEDLNAMESIFWEFALISTEKSLPLIKNICSDTFYEKFHGYTFLISACLFAYKRITDKNMFKFFTYNYSKIKHNYIHKEEALIEKIDYCKKNLNTEQGKIIMDYYKYLLDISRVYES